MPPLNEGEKMRKMDNIDNKNRKNFISGEDLQNEINVSKNDHWPLTSQIIRLHFKENIYNLSKGDHNNGNVNFHESLKCFKGISYRIIPEPYCIAWYLYNEYERRCKTNQRGKQRIRILETQKGNKLKIKLAASRFHYDTMQYDIPVYACVCVLCVWHFFSFLSRIRLSYEVNFCIRSLFFIFLLLCRFVLLFYMHLVDG